MSTPTPPVPPATNGGAAPVEPVKQAPVIVVAPVAVAKPWYAQWSNYAGVLIGIIGNLLPYLTPDFLESIGVSATASHSIGSIVAVILVAYKEKVKPVTMENAK